jgi:hypothetical protein
MVHLETCLGYVWGRQVPPLVEGSRNPRLPTMRGLWGRSSCLVLPKRLCQSCVEETPRVPPAMDDLCWHHARTYADYQWRSPILAESTTSPIQAECHTTNNLLWTGGDRMESVSWRIPPCQLARVTTATLHPNSPLPYRMPLADWYHQTTMGTSQRALRR